MYIGLPLAWVATIPMNMIGGALLAGAYWMTIGYLIRTDTVEASAPAGRQTAVAV